MADSTSTPAREPTERPSIDWGRPLSSLRGIATSAVTQEENASSTYRIQRASRRQTLEGDEGVTGQALSTRRKHSTSLQMRRTLRFSPIAHARHEACEPLCVRAPRVMPHWIIACTGILLALVLPQAAILRAGSCSSCGALFPRPGSSDSAPRCRAPPSRVPSRCCGPPPPDAATPGHCDSRESRPRHFRMTALPPSVRPALLSMRPALNSFSVRSRRNVRCPLLEDPLY